MAQLGKKMGGLISKSQNYKATKMDNGAFVFLFVVPTVGLILCAVVILLSEVTL